MSDMLRKPNNFENVSSHERGESPTISFEAYREFCDSTDGFRKVGIQDEDSYEATLQNERTVFTDHEGQRIPLLAPLGDEKMYDEERCLIMSSKKNAMLLAIPITLLENMQLDNLYDIGEDTLVIVEEFVPIDESLPLDEHDTSLLPFMNAKPFNFVNPNLLQHPHNATAWMAAYEFEMTPREGENKPYEGGMLAEDIVAAWQAISEERGQPVFPGENSTGTFLLSSEQLAEKPEIIEQLWEISQIGFGKILGAHHPIAMEFNKQFFDKQIAATNTITAAHYVDGEIVCFGFVGLDMTNNEWINENSTAIKQEVTEAETTKKPLVHFHELIGRGEKGMGYSSNILQTLFEATSRTGYSYSVFFESTNLSSLYIRPLIERNLKRSDKMEMSSDIKTLGKLSYWSLVAEQPNDVIATS